VTDTAGKVFVAGHRGLVGGAILRALAKRGYSNVVTRLHADLDLTDQLKVREFFESERPEVVYLAAAKVGGIQANNTQRWDFLRENLELQTNVLGSSLDTGVTQVIFFGSSCIYPRLAKQPIKEEYLLTGPLEPTNEPYAIAKIAGLKLVEAANRQHGKKWVSLMPTNLYGPGDNFDLETSHVLPALIRKFHEARIARENGEDAVVRLWGTGKALREFLFVEDLARAACDVAESENTGLYNVGHGSEVSIAELAEIIARVIGYDGPIEWDDTKPDGTPRKLLDSERIRATGWRPEVDLEEGIRLTYDWFRRKSPEPSHTSPGLFKR
jgi:GDP-L-fucose synthase